MTSSRLPGKVLLDIAGKPTLGHMLERLKRSMMLDGVVVATTTDPLDDVLEHFCHEQGTPCYRGSLHDVLDRVYHAAAQHHAGIIVRLTADCPLIDPQVLDLTVSAFLGLFNSNISLPDYLTTDTLVPDRDSLGGIDFDFATNRLPPPWKRTLPIGLDVEVCSFASLQRVWQEAHEPHQREHVLPYLYEGITFEQLQLPPVDGWYVQSGATPRGFKVALLNHAPDYGSLRWTVDTPEDLEFVRQVYARFDGSEEFTWRDVLTLLQNEPELSLINADVKHKSAFDVDQHQQSR
jgi:spore coat polysaccharide biosynthesis protein SpsF